MRTRIGEPCRHLGDHPSVLSKPLPSTFQEVLP